MLVTDKLRRRRSPEQIAGWLTRIHPDDPQRQVSHETIYRSLFVQTRGALKHELTGCLRTRRRMRRPLGSDQFRAATMGQLRDVVSMWAAPLAWTQWMPHGRS